MNDAAEVPVLSQDPGQLTTAPVDIPTAGETRAPGMPASTCTRLYDELSARSVFASGSTCDADGLTARVTQLELDVRRWAALFKTVYNRGGWGRQASTPLTSDDAGENPWASEMCIR